MHVAGETRNPLDLERALTIAPDERGGSDMIHFQVQGGCSPPSLAPGT